MKKMTFVALIAALGCGMCPSALAQQPVDSNSEPLAKASAVVDDSAEGGATDTKSKGLEEVLVTARRTAENMQDVPVAITAFSAADLRRANINSPTDLQGRVPSLVIASTGQARNNESPAIRGQGGQFGSSPGVVIYVGQVALPTDPIANNQGGPGKFFDLGNVQVLKGSQGTLFGRNTTGGALLLEPNKPSEDFYGSVRAGVSNYSGESFEAVLNQPLIEDTLFTRLAVQYVARDGFTKDVVTGKDYDNKNYLASRLGVIWQPTEKMENYFLGYYTDSDDNGSSQVIKQINRKQFNEAVPSGLGPTELALLASLLPDTSPAGFGCAVINVYAPSSDCGQDILDAQEARGNRRVSLSADPTDQIRTGGLINNFAYDLTDNMSFRSITSYSTFWHYYRLDLDGSSMQFVDFDTPPELDSTDLDTFTQELQLQGNAFDWARTYVAGLYYETTEALGNITGSQLMFTESAQFYTMEKTSFAPFVQTTVDLGSFADALSGLSLTAGARYTFDRTKGYATLEAFYKDPGPDGSANRTASYFVEHTGAAKSEALTYTVGLDYKLDTMLLYGKVSRGYKTGGFATIAVSPHLYTFKPEFVTNYEIGEKADFELFDIPMRLNSAIYYTDYTDMQRSIIDSYVEPNSPSPSPQIGQSTINVGKAYVAGFEADLTARVTENFTFMGTYSYGKGEYEEFSLLYGGVSSQKDCSGEDRNRGDILELSCIPFELPEHTYSLTARYHLPIDESLGDVEASLTYAYVGTRWTAQTSIPGDEPGAQLPSAGLLGANLSWNRVFGSKLDLQVFGTNLEDKEYPINNSLQWHLTYFQAYIYSEPRIVGLNLNYHWGE